MVHIMSNFLSMKMYVCLCACILICSCAAPVKQSLPPKDAASLFKLAETNEKSGNKEEAGKAYFLLWKTFPGNELAPESLYRAAKIASARNPGEAVPMYRSFLSLYPKSPLNPKVRRSLLEDEIKLGNYFQAYTLFRDIFSEKPDSKLVQQGVTIANGLSGERNYSQVLDVISAIFSHADKGSQKNLLALWKSAVETVNQIEALEELEDTIHDDRLRDIVLAWEAKLYFEQGNHNIAQNIIAQIGPGKAFSSLPGQGVSGMKSVVGVLLPLSGKWESVGRKALEGIEFASRVFSSENSPNIEYLIRDYGDNEQALPGIIEQLDTKDNVVAIIGPIGESAGIIACREAQKRGIPTIVFTRAEVISVQQSFCFSNFVSVDIQVEALLKAASERNITRFAILYPTDNFGKIFTSTFLHKCKDYGIEVVRQAEYVPDKIDYKGAVQRLIKKTSRPQTPGPGFDAVLIPDTATNAAVMATYLTYFNVKGVRLFGPNLWDTPEFIRIGGRSVEDAVFVSGFYANSQQKHVQDFNIGFSSTFGSKPSIWEASACDTANILQIFTGFTSSSRKDLQRRIGSLQNYHGLTGKTSFRDNGSVKKDIYILTVKNASVVEIIP